ncbi:unnamed protein product [Musa acuminata subsp. malaccensis]|uniref:(wild Malaysian banana) hypothetical protein n=1 Tax=Musa acuminata subsp. malaccensis TaxID=214687 RepID=A0A804L117_MUSAM|nr:unnamed protein product [Musa acuminata subsp. malaccensis]
MVWCLQLILVFLQHQVIIINCPMILIQSQEKIWLVIAKFQLVEHPFAIMRRKMNLI